MKTPNLSCLFKLRMDFIYTVIHKVFHRYYDAVQMTLIEAE